MTLHYNGDPNATLSTVYSADKAEYDRVYRPLNRQMIASTDSTGIVDNARANANNYYDDARSRELRMAERFGIHYSAFEQAESGRRSNAARGLSFDQIVNTSRMQQYERNNTVRNDMVAVGRGIDKSAYAQLESAANLQTQRENANRQIAAQNSAAGMQMMGSLASSALMAFAVF